MKPNRTVILILPALFVVSGADEARATRVRPMPVKDLFQGTALVFVGTARDAAEPCKEVPQPCRGVAFDKLEVVAGSLPRESAELAFALPEGRLADGTELRIVGAPVFEPGERYLVFVRSGEWFLTPVTNWFHGFFREIAVGPEGRDTLFVNHQGLAVTGLGEEGFILGERIAAPRDVLETARGARFGTASNDVAPVAEKVRKLLAQGAAAELGMPKEKLLAEIARWSERYGLGTRGEVRFAPSRAGTALEQLRPEGTGQGGLAKATPTPLVYSKEVFPGIATKDKEVKGPGERPRGRQSTPGREMGSTGEKQ